jgi:hypothetical protein
MGPSDDAEYDGMKLKIIFNFIIIDLGAGLGNY